MKPWLKAVIYLTLILVAAWAARGVFRSFNASATSTAPSAPEAAQGSATESDSATTTRSKVPGAKGQMMNFIGLFLVCTIALGLLLAHDASQWFASKTTDFLYNDNLEGMHNPDYDKAEEVALSGRHLEAIQLLRDFLKKNPSELYAQIRIAELYEGELKNYLAAALEYEEVLKHKFHPERWGWAAIHLVNLYAGRLDQPDKATAWLRRIETEYPTTGPAKKAREKLGSPEPTVASAEQKDDRPPSGSGGLPPGFSPKKR